MKPTMAILAAIVVLSLAGTPVTRAQSDMEACLMNCCPSDDTKQKGWLGVSISDMNEDAAERIKSKATSGALVRDVVEDSPAEAAGIEDDDVIVEFNGKPIADADALSSAVRKTKPGETVTVVVYREDQKKSLQVKVGKHRSGLAHLGFAVPDVPPIHVEVFGGSEINGLKVMTLNSQLGEYFGAPSGKGVLVERVKGKSAAAKAGFKAGDVILKLGDEEIEETQDLWSAMEDYEKGDTATFRILRKGASLSLAMMVTDTGQHSMKFFQHKLRKSPKLESGTFWFDGDEFSGKMKQLQEELKSVGEQVRIKMLGLRKRLERELRAVGT